MTRVAWGGLSVLFEGGGEAPEVTKQKEIAECSLQGFFKQTPNTQQDELKDKTNVPLNLSTDASDSYLMP